MVVAFTQLINESPPTLPYSELAIASSDWVIIL